MQKAIDQLRDPPWVPPPASENSVEKCYNLGPKSQIPLHSLKFLSSDLM